ncbi:MAG: hypothetical protein V4757_07310 [Pseudomonadota bacterium]
MADIVQELRDYRTEDDARYDIEHPICDRAADVIERLQHDNARMRDLLDRRPAMNTGLVEAFVKWTALVYASDIAYAASPDGMPPKLVEH